MTTPRPTNVGLEEVETTTAERFLALLLGVFVLVGLVWAYQVPLDLTDDVVDPGDYASARDRTALARTVFLVVVLAASYGLFDQLRRRGSRNLPMAMGVLGASVLMAAGTAFDYLGFDDAGPLFLSLLGIALTVAVSVAYQRALARRLPARRVRKRECPFCGYPTSASGPDDDHCEGCGREVAGPCTTCSGRRRVGARYCGACGAA